MSSLIVEICTIDNVAKVEKADKLDVVTIKGWQCIVGRDNFKVGDLCIFLPPDSIVPEALIDKYKLEFLRKNNKVGTIKLKGQVSQGLVLDLTCLPNKKYKVGDNVAEILHITKWEPPEPEYQQTSQKETIGDIWQDFVKHNISFRRMFRKIFNYYITRMKKKRNKLNEFFNKFTDIENIKHYSEVFKDGEEAVITEKIHGTSARYAKLPIKKNSNQYQFYYGSRNVQYIDTTKTSQSYYNANVYAKIAIKYNLEEVLPNDYTVYGEIYGKGIQDLEYDMKDIDFMVYAISYKNRYLDYAELVEKAIEFKLPFVPTLYVGAFSQQKLDECTKGNSLIAPNQIREGCVVLSTKEGVASCGRKILKSINAEYLLRKKGTEYK
jgi:tRNA-binding EMAP/Myf-like protein